MAKQADGDPVTISCDVDTAVFIIRRPSGQCVRYNEPSYAAARAWAESQGFTVIGDSQEAASLFPEGEK